MPSAAERFFTKVTNDVLEATEQITNVLEEGLTGLFTGSLPSDSSSKSSAGDGQQQQQPTGHEGGGGDEEVWGHYDEDGAGGADDDDVFAKSPLNGMADSVMGGIVDKAAGPQTAYDRFEAFRHAITWSETFILSLVAFQILMFLTTIYVSRKERTMTPRLVFMVWIGGCVKLAERLNRWGAQNWERFATQNYFDRQGFFVSVMFCTPLLLDSLIMLLLFLREASTLLVQVKSEQIRRKRRQQQQQEQPNESSSSTGNNKKKSKHRAKKEN